jgi:hypothetical protein
MRRQTVCVLEQLRAITCRHSNTGCRVAERTRPATFLHRPHLNHALFPRLLHRLVTTSILTFAHVVLLPRRAVRCSILQVSYREKIPGLVHDGRIVLARQNSCSHGLLGKSLQCLGTETKERFRMRTLHSRCVGAACRKSVALAVDALRSVTQTVARPSRLHVSQRGAVRKCSYIVGHGVAPNSTHVDPKPHKHRPEQYDSCGRLQERTAAPCTVGAMTPAACYATHTRAPPRATGRRAGPAASFCPSRCTIPSALPQRAAGARGRDIAAGRARRAALL